MSDSDSDNNAMSDSDSDNDAFTFRTTLGVLGVKEGDLPWTFFRDRGMLDLYEYKWFNTNVYNNLNGLYRRKLYETHTDKGGSHCDTPLFMRVRQAWKTLRLGYEPPIIIDLLDDDSDDEDDIEDSEDNPDDGEDEDDSDDEDGMDDSEDEDDTINQQDDLSEPHKSINLRSSGHRYGQTVCVVPQKATKPHDSTQWDHIVGCDLKKGYWFLGEIIHIRVELDERGDHLTLFHARYDDGDEEDYTLDELIAFQTHKNCTSVAGNKGYKFWKRFLLPGAITKIHFAKNERGEIPVMLRRYLSQHTKGYTFATLLNV